MEREIGEANNKYAESHPNDPIILDGLSPVEYVRNIITEYKTIKELERLKKVSFFDRSLKRNFYLGIL